MTSIYEPTYERSLRDPEGFWGGAAEDIVWRRRWDRVLDDSRPPFTRWFPGGQLNTCENALDVHVARGRGRHRLAPALGPRARQHAPAVHEVVSGRPAQ